MEPLPEAYAEDCAIILPLKHFVFSGCAWCGDDAKSQAVHIVEHHLDVLEEGMEAYNKYKTMCYDSGDILALSMYNESIATAIRRGAPLASYSIDRNGLNGYMKHLTHADTATLICFCCARTCSCLSGPKPNPIRRYRVQISSTKVDLTSPSRFFGMATQSANDHFGLAKCCTRYGTVSDNVTLSEDGCRV